VSIGGGFVPPQGGYSRVEAEARRLENEFSDPPAQRADSVVGRATILAAGTPSPRSLGRGELLVSPGSVTFVPFAPPEPPLAAGALAHARDAVTVTRAWLTPPWAGTVVLLHTRTGYLRVAVPVSAGRRLRSALRAAGVTVQEETALRRPGPPGG
jgi:hypothetical protein